MCLYSTFIIYHKANIILQKFLFPKLYHSELIIETCFKNLATLNLQPGMFSNKIAEAAHPCENGRCARISARNNSPGNHTQQPQVIP